MKFGQMSFPRLSDKADYLQLDVCGLTANEAINRYLAYGTAIPVVLHGDWTKKGHSENNVGARWEEYVHIILRLQELTSVQGFTIHPPFRKKVPMEEFLEFCQQIHARSGVEVWIENRSNSKIWLSIPEEIIEFSQQHLMTIDIPQLYISCGYNNDRLIEVLSQISWENVREMHLANVKRTERNTFVGRKLCDGEIELEDFFLSFLNVPYWTFEILGGVPTFESQVALLDEWKPKGGVEL